MSSDPTRPTFTTAQRRLLTALAGLIVAVLAGAAFALTYDVLRELARYGGVGERWTPLYPAIADTLTTMTILSLVITRNARWWTRLTRWALLLLLIAGGAAISVQDSVWGMSSLPRDAVRAGVAVAPHVMLVIAVWLWLTMFKQIRVARPASEEPAPVETQRGHVKVLEPAVPGLLALEAPTETETEAPRAEPDEPDEHEEHEEPLIPFAADDDLSSEPAPPPLETLPEPRRSVETAPALLPTDVELVRTRAREDTEPRPIASTTRPDIVVPALEAGAVEDADEDDGPPADRAEDPDGGDLNPPPSSNFRSGPTPPAD
ncbi:uncharacterized protein DUF2637 [Actinomadura pelletieri DSM 43383]|uniref:Uncharacterized protein DUF2637 n=1 Tax=Actinomadura pelletieri DSM 43383 TaxID=1120940 RepID=A0A495QHL4_9ACTN|nr:DUF2637 domain-containing protein [Actinomadura pelletieri]RKS71231.1 uncharacterized protein DUF2637 [Actinomadura pelletieri DSM 43383]